MHSTRIVYLAGVFQHAAPFLALVAEAQGKPFERLHGHIFGDGPCYSLDQFLAVGLHPFCFPLCLALWPGFCLLVVQHMMSKAERKRSRT